MNRSRSTLFLIEQLIVIAVFALCAAACVRILADAYITANESRDLSNALLVAESGAESFKAAGGDIGLVARLLGGTIGAAGSSNAVTVFYDKQWNACTEESAQYILSLTCDDPQAQSSLLEGELLVAKKTTGDFIVEIISLTVVARSK